MNLDAALLGKIDDYLSGKLPPDEAAALKQQAANDPEVAETIEFVRLEREGMELILEENLRDKMEKWEEELPPQGPRYGWILGAALVLLTAVAVWQWNLRSHEGMPTPPPSSAPTNTAPPPGQIDVPIAQEPEKQPGQDQSQQPKNSPTGSRYLALAQATYRSPDFSNVRKGSSDAGAPPSVTQQAAALFMEKKYLQAVGTLDSIPAAQRTDALKIRAHAFFNLKNYDLAADDFQALSTDGGRYRGDADWHLLLCHLARLPQKQVEFDALLRKMLDPKQPHPLASKAADLQKRVSVGK